MWPLGGTHAALVVFWRGEGVLMELRGVDAGTELRCKDPAKPTWRVGIQGGRPVTLN